MRVRVIESKPVDKNSEQHELFLRTSDVPLQGFYFRLQPSLQQQRLHVNLNTLSSCSYFKRILRYRNP